MGQVHPFGLRGTIAEKDFVEGEVIVDIPYNLTVELASALLPTPVCASHSTFFFEGDCRVLSHVLKLISRYFLMAQYDL